MRSFVKLHLYYAQRSLENIINITMNWQNLNNYKSSKTLDFVEFV